MLEDQVRELMPQQSRQLVLALERAECASGYDQVAVRVRERIERIRRLHEDIRNLALHALRLEQPFAHAAQIALDRRRIDKHEVACEVDRLVVLFDPVFRMRAHRKRGVRNRQREGAAPGDQPLHGSIPETAGARVSLSRETTFDLHLAATFDAPAIFTSSRSTHTGSPLTVFTRTSAGVSRHSTSGALT